MHIPPQTGRARTRVTALICISGLWSVPMWTSAQEENSGVSETGTSPEFRIDPETGRPYLPAFVPEPQLGERAPADDSQGGRLKQFVPSKNAPTSPPEPQEERRKTKRRAMPSLEEQPQTGDPAFNPRFGAPAFQPEHIPPVRQPGQGPLTPSGTELQQFRPTEQRQPPRTIPQLRPGPGGKQAELVVPEESEPSAPVVQPAPEPEVDPLEVEFYEKYPMPSFEETIESLEMAQADPTTPAGARGYSLKQYVPPPNAHRNTGIPKEKPPRQVETLRPEPEPVREEDLAFNPAFGAPMFKEEHIPPVRQPGQGPLTPSGTELQKFEPTAPPPPLVLESERQGRVGSKQSGVQPQIAGQVGSTAAPEPEIDELEREFYEKFPMPSFQETMESLEMAQADPTTPAGARGYSLTQYVPPPNAHRNTGIPKEKPPKRVETLRPEPEPVPEEDLAFNPAFGPPMFKPEHIPPVRQPGQGPLTPSGTELQQFQPTEPPQPVVLPSQMPGGPKQPGMQPQATQQIGSTAAREPEIDELEREFYEQFPMPSFQETMESLELAQADPTTPAGARGYSLTQYVPPPNAHRNTGIPKEKPPKKVETLRPEPEPVPEEDLAFNPAFGPPVFLEDHIPPVRQPGQGPLTPSGTELRQFEPTAPAGTFSLQAPPQPDKSMAAGEAPTQAELDGMAQAERQERFARIYESETPFAMPSLETGAHGYPTPAQQATGPVTLTGTQLKHYDVPPPAEPIQAREERESGKLFGQRKREDAAGEARGEAAARTAEHYEMEPPFPVPAFKPEHAEQPAQMTLRDGRPRTASGNVLQPYEGVTPERAPRRESRKKSNEHETAEKIERK